MAYQNVWEPLYFLHGFEWLKPDLVETYGSTDRSLGKLQIPVNVYTYDFFGIKYKTAPIGEKQKKNVHEQYLKGSFNSFETFYIVEFSGLLSNPDSYVLDLETSARVEEKRRTNSQR